MRFNPAYMTNEHRDLFLSWLEGEGLDPSDILNDGRFSVHKGWISGHKFIKTPESRVKMGRDGESVITVHFRQKQKNELPKELVWC